MTCLVYDFGSLPKSFRWRGRAEFRSYHRYVKTSKFLKYAEAAELTEGKWSDQKSWEDTEEWGKYAL